MNNFKLESKVVLTWSDFYILIINIIGNYFSHCIDIKKEIKITYMHPFYGQYAIFLVLQCGSLLKFGFGISYLTTLSIRLSIAIICISTYVFDTLQTFTILKTG